MESDRDIQFEQCYKNTDKSWNLSVTDNSNAQTTIQSDFYDSDFPYWTTRNSDTEQEKPARIKKKKKYKIAVKKITSLHSVNVPELN